MQNKDKIFRFIFSPPLIEYTIHKKKSQADSFVLHTKNRPTQMEQFLIMLMRSELDSHDLRVFPTKESMENHLVSEIMHIIEENTYDKISVEAICTRLNYSRAYLSKIFKAASGYTILEYILMRKIREAKKLIREEKYNFSEISDMLSFDNPHYFSTVFKKQTNMTPTAYKNSVRKL